MKAIIQNNETFKLTGERGDFYITENSKGKCKMFLKLDVNVIEISEMPKVKKYKSHEFQENQLLNQLLLTKEWFLLL